MIDRDTTLRLLMSLLKLTRKERELAVGVRKSLWLRKSDKRTDLCPSKDRSFIRIMATNSQSSRLRETRARTIVTMALSMPLRKSLETVMKLWLERIRHLNLRELILTKSELLMMIGSLSSISYRVLVLGSVIKSCVKTNPFTLNLLSSANRLVEMVSLKLLLLRTSLL